MISNAKWIIIATYASVATALILVFIKSVAWVRMDSVAILASLLDSALDVMASLMIAVAVVISQAPPDNEHRFGHGKAEPLAALAQSIFIVGSAFYLIIYSFERLWSPQLLQHAESAILYMVFALVMTMVLISFQRFVIIKTNSTAIRADSLHYISDLFSMTLVIISLWLSHIQWLDPLLGLLIAIFILRSAFKIAIDSGNQLLDRELPDDIRQEIQEIILKTPNISGFNDLRTYQSGPNRFVQFDLELDDNLTVLEAHDITEQVTNNLKEYDPDLDIMIHQEPASLQDDPTHHNWGKE